MPRVFGPGGQRDRDPARGDRPRNRGDAGGDRLLAAARSQGARRPSCSTSAAARRNWCGSSAIRNRRTRAADQGLDVIRSASSRWRAFRRQGRDRRFLCAHGGGSRAICRAVRAEHASGSARHAHAGYRSTVTTLAGVHLNLARYDRRRIDGVWMNDSEVTDVITRLLGMSYQERARNNCISVERADLVLAAAPFSTPSATPFAAAAPRRDAACARACWSR